jgi:hypothetical protein
MSEEKVTTSLSSGSATSQPDSQRVLSPARIDFVTRMSPVPDKLGLGPDPHLRLVTVWKVLVNTNGEIVQNLGLAGCTTQDLRIVN